MEDQLAGKQACFAYEALSAYVLSSGIRFAIAYVIHVVSLRQGRDTTTPYHHGPSVCVAARPQEAWGHAGRTRGCILFAWPEGHQKGFRGPHFI